MIFMTLQQSQRLVTRQIAKLSLAKLRSWEKRKLLTPMLAREIFLRSTDENVCLSFHNYFDSRVKEGDMRSLKFLNDITSEKVNSSIVSRMRALEILGNLVLWDKKMTLKGLLIGVTDSDAQCRKTALFYLKEIAERNEPKVLPGLLKGLEDSVSENRNLAFSGVMNLARHCDRRVFLELVRRIKEHRDTHDFGINGITILAGLGDKVAHEFLKEYGQKN